jgi:hypothetical protein
MLADVGSSDADSASEAAREAAEGATQRVENPDIVYLFSSVDYDQKEIAEKVQEHTGADNLVGCSTGGEITSEGESTGTVAVMAMETSGEVSIGVGLDISEDEQDAGREAAKEALEGFEELEMPVRTLKRDGYDWTSLPKVNFSIFSTTLTGSGSEVMRGIIDVVGDGFQAAGGMAGDDWELENTYVYRDGEVLFDAVVVAAIRSEEKRSVGVEHGLQPTEKTFKVTSADGNVVKELDGRPPLEVYKELFGKKAENAQFLMTKPLGLEAGEEELRLRDPLIINDDGSIVFAGEVQENKQVTVMESPADEVIDGTKRAAEEAYENAGEPDNVEAVIVHDCVCRWSCLENSETRNREIQSIQDVVGEDVPIIGWYTYGELALPRTLAGMHNQTAVVQLFADE